MDTGQLKHLLNMLVNFEINKLTSNEYLEYENKINDSDLSANVVNLNHYKKKKE
jgi:hypothetical protein